MTEIVTLLEFVNNTRRKLDKLPCQNDDTLKVRIHVDPYSKRVDNFEQSNGKQGRITIVLDSVGSKRV